MSDHVGTLRGTLLALAFGALLGVVAVVLLMVLGGFSFSAALFLGIVTAAVVGGLVAFIFSRPLPTMAEVQAARAKAAPVAPRHEAAPAAPPEPPAAPVVAAAAAPAAVMTAPAPAPDPAPAGGHARPPMLAAPREGRADDLKLIKGVGPKLEEMLHGMGIYHFDQIAQWREAELAWVDENLEGFKGRASRDNWIGQAKILAAGGTIPQ